MRIAVIGAGISGLVAARELATAHEVHVFESEGRLGGHTHTVPVDGRDRTWPVDTGFIVFNPRAYPRFCRLLDELGVASQETTMSFSVHDERTGLEYNGGSWMGLFSQKRNLFRPSFIRMLADIRRFHEDAARWLEESPEDLCSVRSWVASRSYGSAFADHYLVPLGASLWSCTPEAFLDFPMRFVVAFFQNHEMLQASGRPVWRVVVGGSSTYLRPLVRPFRDGIRTGAPVEKVRRVAGRVEVCVRGESPETFDEAVLACHADQALALVEDPTPHERSVLSTFRYTENAVTLHTDTSLLPRRRRAWAAWNFRITRESGMPRVTYNMNLLQGLDARDVYLVSLNQDDRIDPASVKRRLVYHHPMSTVDAERARSQRDSLIRHRGLSYCGAYWGFGFHEDGVRSGQQVAARIKVSSAP